MSDQEITDFDIYLFGEGRHERIYEKLGAHPYPRADVRGTPPVDHGDLAGVNETTAGVGGASVDSCDAGTGSPGAAMDAGDAAAGTRFAVWAPNAERVSVVGPFNHWDGNVHVMRSRASSGIWELKIPGIGPGTAYKYEIRGRDGRLFLKADPYGFAMQLRPQNSSIVTSLDGYEWRDSEWLARRGRDDPRRRPFNAYEVHLGSWRRPWDLRTPPFTQWLEAV